MLNQLLQFVNKMAGSSQPTLSTATHTPISTSLSYTTYTPHSTTTQETLSTSTQLPAVMQKGPNKENNVLEGMVAIVDRHNRLMYSVLQLANYRLGCFLSPTWRYDDCHTILSGQGDLVSASELLEENSKWSENNCPHI